jgi:uncharacterized MAPEG superfamily protein
MSVEMQMLLWACALGLVQIGIAATAGTMQRGLKWNAGARDEAMPPLTGVAGRLDRAQKNFLETFPFFAVAVIVAVMTNKTSAHTAQGAQLYFWARVAYVPLYALGISYVRTLVWAASLVGLLWVLLALF